MTTFSEKIRTIVDAFGWRLKPEYAVAWVCYDGSFFVPLEYAHFASRSVTEMARRGITVSPEGDDYKSAKEPRAMRAYGGEGVWETSEKYDPQKDGEADRARIEVIYRVCISLEEQA